MSQNQSPVAFVILQNKNSNQHYALYFGDNFIGRSSYGVNDNIISIDHPSISAVHAEISVDKATSTCDTTFVLKDLASALGTFVKDRSGHDSWHPLQPLDRHRSCKVTPGSSLIKFGDVECSLERDLPYQDSTGTNPESYVASSIFTEQTQQQPDWITFPFDAATQAMPDFTAVNDDHDESETKSETDYNNNDHKDSLPQSALDVPTQRFDEGAMVQGAGSGSDRGSSTAGFTAMAETTEYDSDGTVIDDEPPVQTFIMNPVAVETASPADAYVEPFVEASDELAYETETESVDLVQTTAVLNQGPEQPREVRHGSNDIEGTYQQSPVQAREAVESHEGTPGDAETTEANEVDKIAEVEATYQQQPLQLHVCDPPASSNHELDPEEERGPAEASPMVAEVELAPAPGIEADPIPVAVVEQIVELPPPQDKACEPSQATSSAATALYEFAYSSITPNEPQIAVTTSSTSSSSSSSSVAAVLMPPPGILSPSASVRNAASLLVDVGSNVASEELMAIATPVTGKKTPGRKRKVAEAVDETVIPSPPPATLIPTNKLAGVVGTSSVESPPRKKRGVKDPVGSSLPEEIPTQHDPKADPQPAKKRGRQAPTSEATELNPETTDANLKERDNPHPKVSASPAVKSASSRGKAAHTSSEKVEAERGEETATATAAPVAKKGRGKQQLVDLPPPSPVAVEPPRIVAQPLLSQTTVKSESSSSAQKKQQQAAVQTTVLMTGVINDRFSESNLKKIGCTIVEDARLATVIITASPLKRSPNLMIGINAGVKHIVSTDWLNDSLNGGKMRDPQLYQIRDLAGEARWGFRLKDTLALTRGGTLFAGRKFLITEEVCGNGAPKWQEMKDIIESGGGSLLTELPAGSAGNARKRSGPNSAVNGDAAITLISSEAYVTQQRSSKKPSKSWSALVDAAKAAAGVLIAPAVYSPEYLFTGILRQRLDPKVGLLIESILT